MGRIFSYVCEFVTVYPCSERKTARATKSIVSRDIVHGRLSECIDPEVKMSKVKIRIMIVVMVRMSESMGLHVDTAAHFSS